MSRNIKKIFGCFITIVLSLGLIQYSGHLLDPDWAEDGFDVIKAFDQVKDNSLDVIVYGSSHAWKGCDTRVMYNDYDIQAYNYGANWQSINTTSLFMEDSLRSQNPKVAFVETGLVNQVEKDTDLNGQIYYTKPMKNSDAKRKYLKQCFGNNLGRYIQYSFPLVMFHDDWSKIDYENFLYQGSDRFVETRGFMPIDYTQPFDFPDYTKFEQNKLNENSINVLDEIVSICEKNNIKLVFYTCPYPSEYNYSEAMKEYSVKNNCTYLDLYKYNNILKLDGEKDFSDLTHVNMYGATKVAKFLSNYIIENNLLN